MTVKNTLQKLRESRSEISDVIRSMQKGNPGGGGNLEEYLYEIKKIIPGLEKVEKGLSCTTEIRELKYRKRYLEFHFECVVQVIKNPTIKNINQSMEVIKFFLEMESPGKYNIIRYSGDRVSDITKRLKQNLQPRDFAKALSKVSMFIMGHE